MRWNRGSRTNEAGASCSSQDEFGRDRPTDGDTEQTVGQHHHEPATVGQQHHEPVTRPHAANDELPSARAALHAQAASAVAPQVDLNKLAAQVIAGNVWFRLSRCWLR